MLVSTDNGKMVEKINSSLSDVINITLQSNSYEDTITILEDVYGVHTFLDGDIAVHVCAAKGAFYNSIEVAVDGVHEAFITQREEYKSLSNNGFIFNF